MNGSGRIYKALLAATLVVAALVVGCSGGSDGDREELLVFAATSLTDAFDEAVAVYERENDVDVQTSYAASQALAQQIASGAPASVFVSAGAPPVAFLRERGLVAQEAELADEQAGRGHEHGRWKNGRPPRSCRRTSSVSP